MLYPNLYGFKESGATQLLTYAVMFVLYYCEDPFAIIINALAYGFSNFWIEIAYERGTGVYEALLTIFSVLILFLGECATGMVELKIANLYKKLATSNQQHVKMLHNMHEGVLIFSQIDEGGAKIDSASNNFSESYSLNTSKGNTSTYSQKVLTDTRKLLFSNKPADKLASSFLEKAPDKRS